MYSQIWCLSQWCHNDTNEWKGYESPLTWLLWTYLCTQHTGGQMEPYNSHPHSHILRSLLYQKSCELDNESTEDLERQICRTHGHRLGMQKEVKIETWEQIDLFQILVIFSNEFLKYEIRFVKNKLQTLKCCFSIMNINNLIL